MTTRRLITLALAASLLPTLAQSQAAQTPAGTYPDKPITLVVGFPPGGGADALARFLSIKLGELWKVPVVVENRVGASGMLAANTVVRAKPDGYTVYVGGNTMLQLPWTQPAIPFDMMTSFSTVTQLARTGAIIAVPVDSKANSMKDVVAMVKAEPGKHSYGSYGAGTSAQIYGELMNRQGGIDMVHVPYAGSIKVLGEIIGKSVTIGFADTGSALAFATTGKVKPIAVTGKERLRQLPNVPTAAESGFTGFDAYGWWGLFMPAGTPQPVLDKFSVEVNRIMATQDYRDRLDTLGLMPAAWNSPQLFAGGFREDGAFWKKIIQETGVGLIK